MEYTPQDYLEALVFRHENGWHDTMTDERILAEEVLRLRERVRGLLEANNREVARRRAAQRPMGLGFVLWGVVSFWCSVAALTFDMPLGGHAILVTGAVASALAAVGRMAVWKRAFG